MESLTIVGVGISGLSAAHFIKEKFPECQINLIDSGSRVGGNFQTDWVDGFVFESGPRGVPKNADAFFYLLEIAGLSHRLIPSRKKSNNFKILVNNKIEKLSFNLTNLFSSPIMMKIFVSVVKEWKVRNQPDTEDESCYDFFVRRFGTYVTENVLDGLLAGRWAGDLKRMSAKSTIPDWVRYEKEFGSVVRGWFFSRKKRKQDKLKNLRQFPHSVLPEGSFYTFDEGMQSLAKWLGNRFRHVYLNSKISNLRYSDLGWTVVLDDDQIIHSEHLLLATPSYITGKLLRTIDHDLSVDLTKIEYMPIVVVQVAYRHLSDGENYQSFVVSNNQKKKILGIIHSTGTFRHIAPNGGKSFTVLLGGAHFKDVLSLPEKEIETIVLDSMKTYYSISQPPNIFKIKKIEHALPQYGIGHQNLLDHIINHEKKHHYLHLLGNWKNGLQINDCVKSSFEWAEQF